MNSSGALLVLGGSPGLQAAPWLAVGASDGNAATDGLLVNDSRDRNQRGNRPPENEAQLQYRLRQIQVRADPGESAPDQGCAKTPSNQLAAVMTQSVTLLLEACAVC
jgi:hypothetical protein